MKFFKFDDLQLKWTRQASDARMAAAAAARREARVEHIARKHEHAAKRGEDGMQKAKKQLVLLVFWLDI